MDPKVEVERAVYEAPILAKVGSFAGKTQGKAAGMPEGGIRPMPI